MALFAIPIALLYWGVVPLRLRFWLGGVGCLIAFSIVAYERWPMRKLGLRFDNLRSALIPYALFTVVGVLSVLVVARLTDRIPRSHWWEDPFFRYYLVPICVLQEVVFRGFLMPVLQNLCRSATAVIVWNSLLFASPHVIYPDPAVALPAIFVGGIGFASIYQVYPNLLLVTASHVALNFVAVVYCYFSFLSICSE